MERVHTCTVQILSIHRVFLAMAPAPESAPASSAPKAADETLPAQPTEVAVEPPAQPAPADTAPVEPPLAPQPAPAQAAPAQAAPAQPAPAQPAPTTSTPEATTPGATPVEPPEPPEPQAPAEQPAEPAAETAVPMEVTTAPMPSVADVEAQNRFSANRLTSGYQWTLTPLMPFSDRSKGKVVHHVYAVAAQPIECHF